MNANKLYEKLDKDFGIETLRDDWSFMSFNDYIAPSFKRHYMGIMLDNTVRVKKVYTAVFPDSLILNKIIESGGTDSLLFCHHAMGYDGSASGFPFNNIPDDYLLKLKEHNISLYVLHVPLDKNGEFSTSVNLAKNLELEIIDEFCEYEGVKVGVICKTGLKTAEELAQYVESVVRHKVKLRNYGDNVIRKGLVAVAAGGGSYGFVAQEIAELGINFYITGCTRPVPTFEPTMEFHKIASASRINVLGATHYTTEKYACIAMTRYFGGLGLEAEFIEGRFYLEDL